MISISKNSFTNVKALVIGDAMLDRYFFGKVERQSPEADVPVVDIDSIENQLGGAANVALNLKKLNAEVALICCVGNDETGKDFLKLLDDKKVISEYILTSEKRKTTLKGRVYNNDAYLLRLDRENLENFDQLESEKLMQNIQRAIDTLKPDVAILQDYNKGLFTAKNIGKIITLLQKNKVKIAVDPKKDNFFAFKNVDLFKPNLKEISEALNLEINPKKHVDLKKAYQSLHSKINCKSVLITLSEHGVVSFDKDQKYFHFPAKKRNVLDVSGAGDTVISVAALCLALGFSTEKIAQYSNIAGGMVIEKKGIVAISIHDLIDELN